MRESWRATVVQHWVYDCWVGVDGRPCEEGAPGAKFVKSRKVPAGTPGAIKVKKKSGKWYGRIPRTNQPVPLSANKVAAQQLQAAKFKKAELARAGILDPFEGHRNRSLMDHLDEYRRFLEAEGNCGPTPCRRTSRTPFAATWRIGRRDALFGLVHGTRTPPKCCVPS
jgi:hypothetical protein